MDAKGYEHVRDAITPLRNGGVMTPYTYEGAVYPILRDNESSRFVSIRSKAGAIPAVLFEHLSEAGLLVREEGPAEETDKPQLRFLGSSATDVSTDVWHTFEDINTPDT